MSKKITKIFDHFNFNSSDRENLMTIQSTMSDYSYEVAEKFYVQLTKVEEAKKFLPNKKVVADRIDTLAQWFCDLFSGEYDERYLQNIKKIGIAHVHIGLDGHFVNAGISYIRNYTMDIINKHYSDLPEIGEIKSAVSKILDINLDIMTQSYHDAKMEKVFLSRKLESGLIRLAERFTYGLNLVLVTALMGISVGIVGLFVSDIYHAIHSGDVSHGVISAMGSLLIIWVMLELMETEIEHLRGKEFPAIIFIHVVLVSFIREVLVVSLQHDKEHQMLMVGTSLILGIIYWLVSNAEKNKYVREDEKSEVIKHRKQHGDE